ncbi:hypothetical protein EDB92DRAFT_1945196 [Lactarius akahatsu]|uniref:Uncharacterized protein n=1 Tax=Lactarius akahatsu TaxID=416441 RepID=A0AAD4LKC2_9AGAM|nr:hypothetical protein EDB92DRAFT_1945196 [Lactarius akahatsu]
MVFNFSRPEIADHIFWTVVAAILFTTSGEGYFNFYSQWVGFLNRKVEVFWFMFEKVRISPIESSLLRNPSKPRKLVANSAHSAMLGDPTWCVKLVGSSIVLTGIVQALAITTGFEMYAIYEPSVSR